MSKSTMRKTWVTIKKQNPDFIKHRGFKTDAGPKLDKIDEVLNAMATHLKKVRELNVLLGKECAAAKAAF